jgi:hypothetical protein
MCWSYARKEQELLDMKRLIRRASVGLAIIAPLALGAPAPAHAAGPPCTVDQPILYALNPANSEVVRAGDPCGGFYANSARTYGDNVRGQYYKDGAWRQSSYGWKYVVTNRYAARKKIIGDTIANRALRGEAYTYRQDVYSSW